MNELQATMQIALANTFVMYFRSHSYHWNVEGTDFAQYHEFFGDLYEELYGAIDPIAEQIRALDAYAPNSIAEMMRYATVGEDTEMQTGMDRFSRLVSVNQGVIDSLNIAFTLAAGNNGLQNFLADRLDQHAKHGWMLRSFLKNTGA